MTWSPTDLKEYTWNTTEHNYRIDEALSYSTLARYEKGGFSSIPHLQDPVESDAITFGSMVDCLITEGREVFDNKFAVVDYVPSDSIEAVIKYLAGLQAEQYLSDISDDNIIAVCNILDYQTRWKNETRVNKIRSEGTAYYTQLKEGEGKTFVDKEVYDKVMKTVNTLKTHPYVSHYFEDDTENIKRYYQAKFRTVYGGVWTKCMFDLLIVNYDKKVITPCDLKTTSLPEYEFAKKYLENRYDIQSRLYWGILHQILQRSEYFKDFTIQPFRFIVINKDTLNPLVFEDKYSLTPDNDIKLKFKSERVTTLRAPVTILNELQTYLHTRVNVPLGISTGKINSLQTQIEKL